MTTTAPATRSVPRLLAVLVALVTVFGALLADFVIPASADQHLGNAAWPPHAKFHDAQYIVMSILLGAVALYLLLRDTTRSRFLTACALLAIPWLSLLAAFLFPGTAIQDPGFDNPAPLGLHPQVLLSLILLTVLAVAAALVARQQTGAPSR
ncbi:DUF6640 family protein [Nocardia sp. NPDC058379]|uniref:DUF6640 family protein n=1 Tax=unclassified Nocardia TaxID=2637762 RepID=UPI003668B6B3